MNQGIKHWIKVLGIDKENTNSFPNLNNVETDKQLQKEYAEEISGDRLNENYQFWYITRFWIPPSKLEKYGFKEVYYVRYRNGKSYKTKNKAKTYKLNLNDYEKEFYIFFNKSDDSVAVYVIYRNEVRPDNNEIKFIAFYKASELYKINLTEDD